MKEGWRGISVSSISAPPAQLLAIVGIVMFLLGVPSYVSCKTTLETAKVNLKMLLLVLPLLLIFTAYSVSKYGRLVVPVPQVKQQFLGRAGGSPWGVAALVVLLLVLVSYRSNFKSMWSPLVWRSY